MHKLELTEYLHSLKAGEVTDLEYCIQCVDKVTNKKGDFVYHKHNAFVALSPVFNELHQLFTWMNRNGMNPGNNSVADFSVSKI